MNERQRFLLQLEREAERNLEGTYATELVAEIKSHLDADIQARIELGLEVEQAESEAVRALGSAKELVSGTVQNRSDRRRPKRFDPRVAVALGSGQAFMVILFLCTVNTEKFGPIAHLAISATMTMFGLWLAAAAWRARRLQILTIIAVSIPAAFCYAGGLAFTFVADDELSLGVGLEIADVPQVQREIVEEVKLLDQRGSDFDEQFQAYLTGQTPQLLGPKWSVGMGDFTMKSYSSPDQAQEAWLETGRALNQDVGASKQRWESQLHDLDEAARRPYYTNALLFLPVGFMLAGAYSMIAFLICGSVWLARNVWERSRQVGHRRGPGLSRS